MLGGYEEGSNCLVREESSRQFYPLTLENTVREGKRKGGRRENREGRQSRSRH